MRLLRHMCGYYIEYGITGQDFANHVLSYNKVLKSWEITDRRCHAGEHLLTALIG